MYTSALDCLSETSKASAVVAFFYFNTWVQIFTHHALYRNNCTDCESQGFRSAGQDRTEVEAAVQHSPWDWSYDVVQLYLSTDCTVFVLYCTILTALAAVVFVACFAVSIIQTLHPATQVYARMCEGSLCWKLTSDRNSEFHVLGD